VTVAYDALLASATPDFVVLAEVQPMERLNSWTAAGGGLTNTYYAAFSTQIATTIVAGGIYRRLDSVRQNATALTLRASSALVDANLGSYFHDTATNRLYVSTTSGVSPDALAIVGAWFTLFLTSTSVSLSGQPLYTPIITDGLPTMTDEMPDTLFGAAFSASGPLTVLNGDGLFDRLSKQYVWRNKLVTFKLGGGSLAYSDFATIDTLRINAITADDEHCTLQLEGLGNILNQSLPLKTWGDGTLFNAPNPAQAADGIDGISQPLVFGQVVDCPCVLGGRNGIAGADYWYAFDSNGGTYGICIVTGVYAVNRTTQARTLLVGGGIDYAVSGANIQVINATYFYESYDIICTLTQLATIGSPKFGTMARAILEICGESTANIDTAAFTAADTAAPQVLARYVGAPVIAADLMRELEQSVNGQVYKGSDGRWTCRIITPDLPASIVDISDVDFVTWTPTEDLRTTLNEVRVRYANVPLGDGWSEVSSTDDAVRYGAETSDAHRVSTWLTTDADASALAGHLRFARGTPAMTIECEQRGLSLISARVGDLVSVTRTRAPNARTGRYDGHLLRIVKIEKALGGDAPVVKTWLNDLDGQADRIFRLVGSGSTLTWSTATAQEQARYGFLGDTNRYLDATDPLTRDGKALY
jgi:hypothetical protein